MSLRSQAHGVCYVCGERYSPGDLIQMLATKVVHTRCAEETPKQGPKRAATEMGVGVVQLPRGTSSPPMLDPEQPDGYDRNQVASLKIKQLQDRLDGLAKSVTEHKDALRTVFEQLAQVRSERDLLLAERDRLRAECVFLRNALSGPKVDDASGATVSPLPEEISTKLGATVPEATVLEATVRAVDGED